MRIKTLTVVSGAGVKSYSLGDKINGEEIDNIVCNSIEFPEAMDHMYAIWAGSDLVAEVINCPVTVECEQETL